MAPIYDSDDPNPISVFQILFLILLHFLLGRFFAGFLYSFLLCAALLFCLWIAHRSIVKLIDAAEPTCPPSVRRNAHEGKYCAELLDVPVNDARQVKLSIDDVKTMMEALDRDLTDNECSKLGLKAEVAGLFDEELRLDEVEEAFDLFDENGDGFIDAEDLKKVLCGLGFRVAYSEVDECRRMIRGYDDDGDGRLNFEEFGKLVERCFG